MLTYLRIHHLLGLLVIVLSLVQCQPREQDTTENTDETTATEIHPVNFPTNLGIPDFSFPEDSNKIYSWLSPNYDSVSIIKHAWGIWAGLTAPSGERYEGAELLVFETWNGASELSEDVQNGKTDCPTVKSGRAPLKFPNQFGHAGHQLDFAMARGADDSPAFMVAVSYDPTAACFATQQQIFKASVLNKHLIEGQVGQIPAFPNTAITLKPTFFVGKATDDLIQIPVWPGPPPSPQGFGFTVWPDVVYVDVNNHQLAGKQLTPAPKNSTDPATIQAATCNLNDFIHFALDSMAAAYVNQQQGAGTVAAGDLALLVAMHVATKEIANWTWQTFYWAPDPDNPDAPSSTVAAGLRPSQLSSAARHYAVATAYAMVLPNQPITGGTNTGVQPIFGYNPYLEASFTGLNDPAQGGAVNALNSGFQYGIQTNCMSCHVLANYGQGVPDTVQAPYTSDQYISVKDDRLLNKVSLDFAWSIQGNLLENQ